VKAGAQGASSGRLPTQCARGSCGTRRRRRTGVIARIMSSAKKRSPLSTASQSMPCLQGSTGRRRPSRTNSNGATRPTDHQTWQTRGRQGLAPHGPSFRVPHQQGRLGTVTKSVMLAQRSRTASAGTWSGRRCHRDYLSTRSAEGLSGIRVLHVVLSALSTMEYFPTRKHRLLADQLLALRATPWTSRKELLSISAVEE